ncbi:hypothetical protein O3P69_020834 [Scylla paramamosain]|uniref:Uncharacterized protein n=1 Tax=Scylla paramamosain TaxID=85552 RepID=A0AAW0TNN6_SCYPA
MSDMDNKQHISRESDKAAHSITSARTPGVLEDVGRKNTIEGARQHQTEIRCLGEDQQQDQSTWTALAS